MLIIGDELMKTRAMEPGRTFQRPLGAPKSALGHSGGGGVTAVKFNLSFTGLKYFRQMIALLERDHSRLQ
jgi:hypothetical protein